MKKLFSCIVLLLGMLLLLAGCGEEQYEEGEYAIYYFNIEKTKIEAEGYDSSGATGEELIRELLQCLQSKPESNKLRRTIPEGIEVLEIKSNGSHLTLDLSKTYLDLSVTDEVLMRAAIVRTLLQSPDYSLVSFTIESEPLTNKAGALIGSMGADSFVENPGQQIISNKEATITLYFASGDGTTLVKETRDVHYSSSISMEKLVMEQLIAGPKQGGVATIPSGTKIITVSVVDGICYVNLDSTFQNQNQEITEEVVLYSIVNSLTELPGVSKVQISVNGDTTGMVRYTYELAKLYERNTALFETGEQ